MRKFSLILSVFLVLILSGEALAQGDINEHTTVGAYVENEHILSATQMKDQFLNLKAGDTLQAAFRADVNSVCKNKGCWMKLNLIGDEEVMVKFRDYAFFVSKDIEGSEVIVHGEAFVDELSVEEQRHYAEDAGATSEEIKNIVKPKRTLSFIADGVKIKK